MRTGLYCLVVMCLVCVSPVLAQEGDQTMDAELIADAMIYSAQEDAFRTYCEEEEGVSDRFLKIFSKREDANDDVVDYLQTLRQEHFDTMLAALQESEKECEHVDIMFRRYEIVEKLKDVSARLRGVDPDTTGDNSEYSIMPALRPFHTR